MAPSLSSLALPLLLTLASLQSTAAHVGAAHLARHGVKPSSAHLPAAANVANINSTEIVIVQTLQTTVVIPPGSPFPTAAASENLAGSVTVAVSENLAGAVTVIPDITFSDILSPTTLAFTPTTFLRSTIAASSSAPVTSIQSPQPSSSSLVTTSVAPSEHLASASTLLSSSAPASAAISTSASTGTLPFSSALVGTSSSSSAATITSPLSTSLVGTSSSSATAGTPPTSTALVGTSPSSTLPTSSAYWSSIAASLTSSAPSSTSSQATSAVATMAGFGGDPHQCPGCLDWIAKLYIVIGVVYTAVIGVGLYYITINRARLAIKMRSYALTVAAILVIHTYLFLIFIVYAIRWWYPCRAEYWVMAIVFPLGLALYNATNARLIYYHHVSISTIQSYKYLSRRARNTRNYRWWQCSFSTLMQLIKRKYWELGFLGQTYMWIIVLMVIQIIVCIIVFFGSRNFHEDYGFFGKWTGANKCFRGSNGEWIPTILWQFGWTWFFGPYCLYRTRMINDKHFWVLQTRVSVLAGLPGTPLWLLFLYSDNSTIAQINKSFAHAGWLIPGLVAMQFSLIVCPLLDLHKAARWDRIAEELEKMDRESDASRSSASLSSRATARTEAKERANKLSVLENALAGDSARDLLIFAAKVQMSAENILFCRGILNLRRKFEMLNTPEPASEWEMMGLYEDATALYFMLVDPETSRMPINIDAKMFEEIAAWFKDCSYSHIECCLTRSEASNKVSPWLNGDMYPDHHQFLCIDEAFKNLAVQRRNAVNQYRPKEGVPAPKGFNIDLVFEKAYLHVRALIFHNTWSAYLDTREDVDLESMGGDNLSTYTDISTPPPSYVSKGEEFSKQAEEAFAALERPDSAHYPTSTVQTAEQFTERTVDFADDELNRANRARVAAARAHAAEVQGLGRAEDQVDLIQRID